MLRLHDTALGRSVELDQREPGKVSLYVCGPTVDNVPHVGHGRAVLVYDVLRRYLEWRGLEVTHVSNVTDIEDKIIRRAEEEGRSAEDVARDYEKRWWDALDRLGVLRPTLVPHATAYVDDIVRAIGELVSRGVAYEADDGIYFEVEKVDGYGLLALQSLDSLRAGARVDVGESKRSPLDFALWKLARPGEPSWPSPWGEGRPGWHTECVVMSLDLLGEGFDLHTGGMDLRFPHHENERAQAVALGQSFARHWMHHAFLEVSGEKMSKSLGNFTSLTDLLARTDARAYRLLVLRSHYRSPMEVTPRTIEDAELALERLDGLADRFGLGRSEPEGASSNGGDPSADGTARAAGEPGEASDARARFIDRMDDDLDTPGALAVVFDLVRRANTVRQQGGDGSALAAEAVGLAGALGLELGRPAVKLDAEIAQLVTARDEARRRRDFAKADSIRDRLESAGWIVEDGPDGTTLRR